MDDILTAQRPYSLPLIDAREMLIDPKLSMNIKKCIFATPTGILLGHVVCKEGIKVKFAKIKAILDKP